MTQRSELTEVRTYFSRTEHAECIAVYTEAENISDGVITIDQVSSMVYADICPLKNTEDATFYRFTQSHHAECQPRAASLYELGLFETFPIGQKRIAGFNAGSWSTKEELPQGIIGIGGKYTMFRIESYGAFSVRIFGKVFRNRNLNVFWQDGFAFWG